MRIIMARKKNQYDYDEFDDENIDTKKQAQRDRNRKKQRRLKNALKSKDINYLLELEEE
tara:strand:+ start:899 stop:1075 length:177 start_codon:yes stop_codon:yes gene_type:complete